MKVAFRVDASLTMGTGHVMRCLTLADALQAKGAECHFLCREHPGNLIEHISNKGYPVHRLPTHPAAAAGDTPDSQAPKDKVLAHSHWLGATQQQDADACAPILSDLKPDRLVVDHYALDYRWERQATTAAGTPRVMVIDDLADRNHDCTLLLDQNLGRTAADYVQRVPADCHLLTGPEFALLRPEFAEHRTASLERRTPYRLRHLLITMGGGDPDNATGQVLEALKTQTLPPGFRVTVVMGAQARWLPEVQQQAKGMPWPTEVKVNVSNMAEIMTDADLAIGGAGSTAWERCCLGLPTLIIILAANQAPGADALQQNGAGLVIGDIRAIPERLAPALQALQSAEKGQEMTDRTAAITDGQGAQRVLESMTRNNTGGAAHA